MQLIDREFAAARQWGRFRWAMQIVSGAGLLVASVYYFRVFATLL